MENHQLISQLAAITDKEFAWAQSLRAKISDRMQSLLGEDALMVLPTSPGPAPLLPQTRLPPNRNLMGTRDRTRPDESKKPGLITPEGYAALEQQSEELWKESRKMAEAVTRTTMSAIGQTPSRSTNNATSRRNARPSRC